MSCTSASWLACLPAQLLAGILQLSWIVYLLLLGLSWRKGPSGKWGKEISIVFLMGWLAFWEATIYVLQWGLAWVRPNPFSLSGTYFGFPSIIGFYTGFGATFVIGIAVMLNIAFSWYYWVGVLVSVIVPPIILSWFNFNTWYETTLSLGFGVVTTILFLLILWHYIRPQLPILLNSEPFTYFNCVDTWLLTREQHEQTERVRVLFER